MKTAVTILFLLLAGLGNLPAQTPHDPAEAELIAAIDRSASAIRSLQCDFTQTKELSLLQDKMVSRGVMYYRQEGGKLHWEYLSPYTYTFVLNGDRVMMRSPGHTDVVETSGNRMFRQIAWIMMHSLTGRCLTQEAEFDTQVRAEDGRWIATLKPVRREMRQFFTEVRLCFDPGRKLVTRVELLEESGDRTVIELKNIRTDVDIDEKYFAVD